MLVRVQTKTIRSATPPASKVYKLVGGVRKGKISGARFCTEVSRLDAPDRTQLLNEFLRAYRDVNNFTSVTIQRCREAV
jgi:hypothetical protein